jgi:hypothetical protein
MHWKFYYHKMDAYVLQSLDSNLKEWKWKNVLTPLVGNLNAFDG